MLLGEVHKLWRLYLTLHYKLYLCHLRLLKTKNLRSTRKQDDLNTSLLLHCHTCYRHIELCRYCKGVCLCKWTTQETYWFWKIGVEVCTWLNDERPPPPACFKIIHYLCTCIVQCSPTVWSIVTSIAKGEVLMLFLFFRQFLSQQNLSQFSELFQIIITMPFIHVHGMRRGLHVCTHIFLKFMP